MYTSVIGKTFLDAYNDKNRTHYDPRSFFEEVFVPLFFDHPKYMMTAGNSPLENPKLSWDDMIQGKKDFETPEKRQDRIKKIINKIENEPADASIAVGYPVTDNTAPTSCQVTSAGIKISKDEVYLSWIGAALGIGVQGGITILFDNKSLLLDIAEGWKHYRQLLNRYPFMKGNQINTWNGKWIAHRYDSFVYEERNPIASLNVFQNNTDELFSINTISWVPVLMGISLTHDLDNIAGYLYNIGQTNTTYGFIPFCLNQIKSTRRFYKRLFGDNLLDIQKSERLYGTAMGLKVACSKGAIGIAAMEPKGLRDYMKSGKKISFDMDNEDQKITFNTYINWIIAMMNNDKIWDSAKEIAQQLLLFEQGAGKAKKNRENLVKQLMDSGSSKIFLQNLIPIIEEIGHEASFENESLKRHFGEIGKEIHLLPKDNFPYFNTLIKFQYALISNN